jgi:superfamily II DNA or RNA helicase
VNDGIQRIIGNCVTAWEILDDIDPERTVEFICQNANPPFGCLWPTPPNGVRADSTEYTWRKIMERASPFGFGWFISNWKTIERLGIHKHPRVYLYQKFPMGVWKGTEVEIGVVHWDVCAKRPEMQTLTYTTLDYSEHAEELAKIKKFYRENAVSRPHVETFEIGDMFRKVATIINEEKRKRPPFNIYLDHNGLLKTYLSTRFITKRKITREEVLRLSNRVDNSHPLTLTTDRESRKLLNELISCGIYTIQPEALAAIRSALAEVAGLSCPIMPVTDFETVAYCDEEDSLECSADLRDKSGKAVFTTGRRYDLTTSTYSFAEEFSREKPHYDEKANQMYTVKHECKLSGTDRFIMLVDNNGKHHRFMDRPDKKNHNDHDEATLWQHFKKPEVKTVAEANPEGIARNRAILASCEMLAGFSFYPGQLEYLARVCCKNHGILAAATGAGKSLMAISLVQVKAPKRALIIAPQGTMRTSSVDQDDEDDEVEHQASQWVEELRKFGPGLPVFQLFSMDDYYRIVKANHGKLPEGVYISYYQAMFSNGARESAPDTWDDERLAVEIAKLTERKAGLPEPCETTIDPDRFWCESIGKEKHGIRCIMEPCMATLVGHHFDMVCLDEGHLCCNLAANVSQMLIRLQPTYRYVFTATPIPNVVANLFSLMGWVCVKGWYKGGQRNAAWPYAREEIAKFIDAFQSEERDYTQEEMEEDAAKKAGVGRSRKKCIKVSPIISSPARLLKILKPSMAYISKPACNPNYVAPKLIDVRVPMGTQQLSLYAFYMNRGNINCKNAMVRARKQITYLRNICADPMGFNHGGPDTPKVTSNFNPKTIAMLELARDITSKGDQFVVICSRKGQTDTIHAAFRDAGLLCSRIDSTIPAEQHSYQANLFKSHKTQALMMGIKCASAHSFHECAYMIVGSLEYSWGSLDQARGRVDRVNSMRPATVYCVLHKHSIEEVMFDVVATKQDAATICLRGQRVPREFKPVDLGEVLATSIINFKTESVEESECEKQWPKLRSSFLA